ncbi:MAG: tRNA 2-thiouridine(34) synthase MnmA [Actinomycetota bacterium]
MKVLAALSGGVDSSVAAALLAEAGHDVAGVTLVQTCRPATDGPGCCSDAGDARRVAAQLGIAHHTLDYTDIFCGAVIQPFAAAYRRGLTPNPCIECNRRVRFGALLEEAERLGFDILTTGHHARVRRGPDGSHLLRGADLAKDQSYVLYMLGQEHLSRLAFPVGEMSKDEVRQRARGLGLSTADKPESQDLCFVGAGGYREFLREQFPEAAAPGPIVDTSGQEIGRHDGVAGFTVGQRRGLGVAVGEARYVVAIRPDSATVVVGGPDDLLAAGCRVGEVSWVAGRPLEDGGLEVKVRYRSPSAAARLEPGAVGEWRVWFGEPQAAVTPGQAAVLYRGDEVVGGGTILEALPG